MEYLLHRLYGADASAGRRTETSPGQITVLDACTDSVSWAAACMDCEHH